MTETGPTYVYTGADDGATGSSDIDMALNMMRALCPETSTIRAFVIPGQPQSKQRYRKGKHGNLYNPSVIDQDAIGWQLRTMFKEPMDCNVAVGCIFYRSNRQRIDVDNLLKLIMDAATGICYHDDDQVTAQLGVLQLDRENPRTAIAIGEHISTMDRSYRTKICETCGKKFKPSLPDRKFCSRACASRSVGEDLSALKACPICAEDFKRKTATQTYCSDECRNIFLCDLHDKRRKYPVAYCIDCGKQLSKPSYVRCRQCWLDSFNSEAIDRDNPRVELLVEEL